MFILEHGNLIRGGWNTVMGGRKIEINRCARVGGGDGY